MTPWAAIHVARAWGREVIDLGEVGHQNPASGFGAWPMARVLIQRLPQPV